MAIDLTLRRDLSRLLFDAEVDDNFVALRDAIQGVLDEKGAASGLATLGADGRLSPGQIPAVQALPATAHDLNTYQLPGMYRQASTAGAQAGTNYPQAAGGLLEVCGTGSPGQTVQRYTVASTGSVSPTSGTRQYWRFAVNASWSAWQEVHTAGNSLPYLGRVEAGADLNNYANRGMWAVAASSVASGGTNFPVANSGWLMVYCEAAAGAAAGTNVNQIYIGSNANRQFFRSLVGGVWSAWEEVVRSSLVGAANGLATLGADGKVTPAQLPNAVAAIPMSQKGVGGGVASLDENSRILQQIGYAEIIFGGTDANDVILPGLYVIQSDANATTALNWPVLLAGTMIVEVTNLGNGQATQTYTTRNGRTFKRVRFSTAGWSAWQEMALLSDVSALLAPITSQLAQTFGAGQSWQNVGASRAPDINYTNSTGRPILISVTASLTGPNGRCICYVDNRVSQDSFNPSSSATVGGMVVVPAGSVGRVVPVAASISSWWEYR
ncbi:MAG: hypothetical protein K0S02_1619 [Achromobacter mucicolens]|jgi:hypothetical protein|uniref:pyocin knob domain-containing protein n=1 Tax=Achromobacter mucicolens TaxID=1389922 RepID=UPI00242EC97B|nr:pyocin knob domain-containing protein [Achromobacter mucicolens]MDF2861347.1 hypothetical protein [Achromobacter mucicolens]